MASHTITKLTDDLDGSDATQTVHFGYAGASYAIDLNDKNAKKLSDALAPYIGAARKSGGARKSSGGGATGRTDKAQTQAMRQWLREKGHQVSERGRISKELKDLYNSGH